MTGRRGDPHRMLMQAVRAEAERGGIAQVTASSSEAWASATFRGARHSLSLHLDGNDAETRAALLAERLGEVEFHLPGHLVADIAVTGRRTTPEGAAIEIEALTLEDG